MWKERLLKYRFALIAAAFVVYMTFFDRNNLISQIEASARYSKMLDDREYYLEEVKRLREERSYLFNEADSNDNELDRIRKRQALEKFGRENYLMKKDNEDLFIIRKSDE